MKEQGINTVEGIIRIGDSKGKVSNEINEIKRKWEIEVVMKEKAKKKKLKNERERERGKR